MPPKHSDSKPGEKLLALYTMFLVQGERYLSIGDMAKALECSKQTILRLLTQMEASGFGKLDAPIVRGREHLYRMAPLPRRKLDLGVQELAQLAQCRNMLINILPKRVSDMLGKMAGSGSGLPLPAMPDPDGPQNQLGLVYQKGYIDYGPFETQYTNLMQGVRQQRVCRVCYRRSPSKTARVFAFAPMRVVVYRENIAFLGWEVPETGRVAPIYDNSLFLYLQRFLSVELTSRKADGLPSPQTAQEGGKPGPFGIIAGDVFQAKVRFAPEAAAYVYDRQWSSEQKCTICDDGSLELDFKVQSDVEAVAWVLGFGHQAEVLEPAWLRDTVREELARTAAQYD